MIWWLHLIQWGAFLALLLMILELLEYPRTNRLLVFLCLAVASIQVRYGLYLENIFIDYTFSTYLFVTTLFAIGPLLFFVIRRALEFAYDNEPKLLLWQMIPAFAVFLYETWFLFQPNIIRIEILDKVLAGFSFDTYNVIMFLGTLHMIVYFLLTAYTFFTVKRKFQVKYGGQVMVTIFLPIAATALVSLGFRLQLTEVFIGGCILITITMLLVIIFRARETNFFLNLKKEVERKKYEKTQLTGLDLDRVQEKIEQLMRDELYLDEDLRLGAVAGQLSITSNQLSRILNERYGKNFNDFINQYRIEHAQKLLLADKEKGVLTIAYESGFNNKVSFNKHFTKLTGKTPSAFRKQG